jgi:hypothetical protein
MSLNKHIYHYLWIATKLSTVSATERRMVERWMSETLEGSWKEKAKINLWAKPLPFTSVSFLKHKLYLIIFKRNVMRSFAKAFPWKMFRTFVCVT